MYSDKMLFKVLVSICLALAATADPEAWVNFKGKFRRTYTSEEQDQLRYQIFQNNLKKIQEHNAKYDQGLSTWYMAVNQFTDLTPEEFRHQYLSAAPANYTRTGEIKIHKSIVKIPSSIDWRTSDIITDVKNQGSCGACWTFSATGALEAAYALQNGQLLSLSEQELLDCATDAAAYPGDGCSGGVVQYALDYVKDYGMVTEEAYPYEEKQGSSCKQSGSVFKISGYTEIKANDEVDLKNAVGSVGPVSVALNADGLQHYGGGVYNDPECSKSINHAVLAVGYGTDEVDYWILKNSWGTGWGESGYAKMAIGSNMCAIAAQACYPNL